MEKKIYSTLTEEMINFAKERAAHDNPVSAWMWTDQHFGLIAGSTASYFGKKGAKTTNSKKKV
jgi:hypothetical protein